ncbi:hypothetical protein [Bifidobacterium pseudolongum]|uniref:Uncharacterized protein n=1 Tax=Bifidobacterium pseudolongum TaxID=1694 RepID=A0A395XD95_9BIFI|nr:hypothetical protein [Bifidobacterium pseudolongum]RGW08608.1 hypothetical protein DWV92_07145 [Bifidobacterium pseudolongum]
MKSITNAQAPAIIERIVRDHGLPTAFRVNTSNRCYGGTRFTIQGFERDCRWVRISVKKPGLPTAHNTRAISKDGEGEYFTFRGVKHHAWQFMTWEEYAAIMADFFARYRIIDSHVPDVHQNCGSVPGSPRFEDALVSSGLPYGDGVDA